MSTRSAARTGRTSPSPATAVEKRNVSGSLRDALPCVCRLQAVDVGRRQLTAVQHEAIPQEDRPGRAGGRRAAGRDRRCSACCPVRGGSTAAEIPWHSGASGPPGRSSPTLHSSRTRPSTRPGATALSIVRPRGPAVGQRLALGLVEQNLDVPLGEPVAVQGCRDAHRLLHGRRKDCSRPPPHSRLPGRHLRTCHATLP